MQTIGERLEEARKKKGVSIREAAEATKIRGDYLQKFESNQFDIGLTEIYTRGFLRTYSSFLKLPVDRVMSDYAALGRGDVRPRQPNREIYGRMDITVASSGEAAERAAPPQETPAAEPPAPSRPQPHYPRGTGSSLPKGMDPVVLFKWLKILGIVALVIILFLVGQALFSRRSDNAARPQPTSTQTPPPIATQPAREQSITLIALNTMRVTVRRKNQDSSYGDVLFDGTMNRGDTQVVQRPGPLYITSSQCESLQIEVNGRRVGMGSLTGYGTGQLPGP